MLSPIVRGVSGTDTPFLRRLVHSSGSDQSIALHYSCVFKVKINVIVLHSIFHMSTNSLGVAAVGDRPDVLVQAFLP